MKLVAAPARLSTAAATFEADFAARLHWSADTDAAIEQRVADILADVQKRGDAAVLEYTARFDGLSASSMAALELTQAELKAAFDAIPAVQRDALQAAAARVRSYHMAQKKASGESWSYRDEDGTLLGQKVTPLDRVGIYVPGGKAAYPSSLIMNAVPAHVAGVGEIIMVVPTPVRGSVATGGSGASTATRGERNELVLAAAHVAGVTRAFTIGGAQAVAALAYGTETVPKVDKITGPGNAYVASAKKRVFGTVGIDMIAGPSEILVLADGSTPADWVAMDLFSQAEHDELAQSILLCPDAGYIARVLAAIDRLLADIRARLPLVPDAEITLEANPSTAEAERFAAYREAGVNRLSLGIQSFNPRHLKALGRIHDEIEAKAAIELAARHFERFSLWNCAGKAIKNTAVDTIWLRDALLNQVDDQIIRHQTACVHHTFGLQP